MLLWEREPDGVLECLLVRDGNGFLVVDRPTAWNELLEPDQITAFNVMEVSALGAHPRRILGWVPPGTERVQGVLDDGTSFTASVGAGRFMAWWPSSSMVAELIVLDGSGRTLAHAGPGPFYPGMPMPSDDPYESAALKIEAARDPSIDRVEVSRFGGITNLDVWLVDGATQADADRIFVDVIGCELVNSELLISVLSGDYEMWVGPCDLIVE
jgi:hypothetical protein